jgi:hypothetical protein
MENYFWKKCLFILYIRILQTFKIIILFTHFV